MGRALFLPVNAAITLYSWVVIIYIVTRMLIQFGVVNAHNQIVQFILQVGSAIVEPALSPIRRLVPPINGFDLSPIILILFLWFLRLILGEILLAGFLNPQL